MRNLPKQGKSGIEGPGRPPGQPRPFPKSTNADAREYTTRDGLSKFIKGADGKPRYTQVWDPVKLELRSTAHGRKYMTEGMASVHVEIPIAYWVTETSRTWPDYLA